jgi:hypothetical protein
MRWRGYFYSGIERNKEYYGGIENTEIHRENNFVIREISVVLSNRIRPVYQSIMHELN